MTNTDYILDNKVQIGIVATLISCVLFPVAQSIPFFVAIALLALLCKPISEKPLLWLSLGVLGAWAVLNNMDTMDNHKWLTTYWLFALAMIMAFDGDKEDQAKRTAQYLIGVVFVCATVWKLFNGEFVDGSALQRIFLVDGRGSEILASLGLISHEALSHNFDLTQSLMTGSENTVGPVQAPESVMAFIKYISWFALYEQAVIGVLFLSTLNGVWEHVRNAHLLTFIFTAYPILPVDHFAMLLSTLGLISVSKENKKTAIAFFVALVAVPLLDYYPYGLPALASNFHS